MGKSHYGAHKQRHSKRLHHGALTSDKDLKGVSFALGSQTSGENIHFNEKKKLLQCYLLFFFLGLSLQILCGELETAGLKYAYSQGGNKKRGHTYS